MVKKIFSFLNKDISSINQAALMLGLTLLGSQFLGLIRDRVLASRLGPGEVLDIYYASFRIPDILYALAASLVSVTILMPFFTKLELSQNESASSSPKRFLSEVMTVFLVFMFLLSVFLWLAMPMLVGWIAPGFSEQALVELVKTSRILLLSPILFGISNIFGVVTQSKRAFLSFGLSPVVYNIGIIIGTLFLYPVMGLRGLVIGVLAGALMHGLIQWPVLFKNKLFPVLVWPINWQRIKSITVISVPRTFALALSQITFSYLIALASKAGEGAVSVFSFARNIQSVPLALIGMTFSVAAFPALVEAFAKSDTDKFKQYIIQPLQQILFWSFPVMVLFIVLRAQIVRVILGGGVFNWDNTRLTAATFALLVLAVVAQSAVLLFVRGYYAAGKTWRPLLVNLVSSSVTVVFSWWFLFIFKNNLVLSSFLEKLMRVDGVFGTEILVLALAFSLGSIINALVLWFMFSKTYLQKTKRVVWRSLWQSLSVSIFMGGVAYLGLQVGALWFDQSTLLGLILQGGLAGLLAVLVGGWLFWAFGNEEFLEVLSVLKKKFWKVKIGGVDTVGSGLS